MFQWHGYGSSTSADPNGREKGAPRYGVRKRGKKPGRPAYKVRFVPLLMPDVNWKGVSWAGRGVSVRLVGVEMA